MKIDVHRKGAGKSQTFLAFVVGPGRPVSLSKLEKSKRTFGEGKNTREACNDLRKKLDLPPIVA